MCVLPARAALLVVLFLAAMTGPVQATPLDFIPVGDPLEDELRVLEVSGWPLDLPRLGLRPLQVSELPAFDRSSPGPAAISIARLRRALARDQGGLDTVPGTTPRALQLAYPNDQRVELSAALEGSGHIARRDQPRLGSGSGLRLRMAMQSQRWLAYSHLTAGYVEGGLDFAEAILPGTDAVLYSNEAFLAYTGEGARWGMQLGRGRWHWGPGREASLLLSKTSAPLTGMALHIRIVPLRADAMILNAALAQATGERLAAHRLEWQPLDGLRIGLSEAARYRSSTWEPLYVIGVIPYPMVQGLLQQDEPESTVALRSNVIAAVDAAWRPVPGTRLSLEVLIDDLRTDASRAVNKYAYQLGWEGVGALGGTRVTWSTEYTRLTRFVYTSFFGLPFTAQDRPIGFPTGPDARRVRVHGAWDPSTAWQLFGSAARTDLGESGIDVYYLPQPSPSVDPGDFAGVVETTRDLELGVRYWPASGLDVAVAASYRWVDDLGHAPGAKLRQPGASLTLRLVR